MSGYRKDIDQHTFERIEKYLLNRMDVSERLLFEEEMNKDESLLNEVGLQRKLLALVEAESFIAAQPRAKIIPVKTFSYKWLYAAAVIVAVSLIAWLLSDSSKLTSQQLYADYFRPDPGLPVVMSSTTQYTFYDGMVSYKEGDYKKAISMWEGLALKSGYTDTLKYFIGVARLNNNDFTKAIEILLPLAKDEKNNWHEKATWYLSLCYLHTDNTTEAEKWLQQLPGDERATKLLTDISRMPSK